MTLIDWLIDSRRLNSGFIIIIIIFSTLGSKDPEG